MELDEEVVENLKRSREIIGEIDEVLLDKDGNIIDGKHRLKAYPGWKTKTIPVDYKKGLLLRLHRNYRRNVSKEETRKILMELAEILKREGTPEEQIAREIVQISPYTETYTLSLLPKKYKQPKAVKAAKATYKILYQQPKPETKTKAPETPQKLTCPICGSVLTLKGNLLVPYEG